TRRRRGKPYDPLLGDVVPMLDSRRVSREVARRYGWFSPWKISLTDSSSNTARDASARIGAIDWMVSFLNCFSSGMGTVFVTTTSLIGASSSFCTALPEKIAWVAPT